MSTLTKTTEDQAPLHFSDISLYFERSYKTASQLKIGVESEFFPVDPRTHEALPFSGGKGVEAILKKMARDFGWGPVIENGRVVALMRSGSLVSLEPGGQVEIATEPLVQLSDIRKSLEGFHRELETVASDGCVEWLNRGFQPQSTLDSIEWVPKARYELMKSYLGATGRLAHDMMKRTASTQVSLDYMDEDDAFRKVRLGFWVSPFVALMAANSPLKEGKPWDWVVPRVHIWNETDPARSGVPAFLLKPGVTFREYLDYVLDIPMIFIVREGKWISVKKTFRQYLEEGFEKYRATLDDFELHMSALFPDVRLRKYIEMRQADSLPLPKAVALAAFWKGLLYSKGSLDRALKLFDGIAIDEFMSFRMASAERGYEVILKGRSAGTYCDNLLKIARQGLLDLGEDTAYLKPLELVG